jgi:hypothetical protein
MSTAGRGGSWGRTGCAALAGAALALPIGVTIGGNWAQQDHQLARSAPTLSDASGRTRNIYSPQVRGDPYVIAQQRRVVDALELSCRQSGQYCKEARQARERVAEAEGRR